MFINLFTVIFFRWKPFDPTRNWPDIGSRFADGERIARNIARERKRAAEKGKVIHYSDEADEDKPEDDVRDLPWATVLKRVFESYLRGERPNMYGEMLQW